MSDSATPITLVRFHDGTATSNWGGRATSLALGRLAETTGHRLAAVVNGRVIVHGSPALDGARDVGWFARGARRRAVRLAGDDAAWRTLDRRESARRFAAVRRRAAGLIERAAHDPEARSVVDAYLSAPEVWVNGEGDLILSPRRRTLERTLVLMQVAQRLGLAVHLLNSILSLDPVEEPEPAMVDALAQTLEGCASVTYRDPASLELHQALLPGIPARWSPDALFLWHDEAAVTAAAEPSVRRFGPATEGLSPIVQAVVGDQQPYVLVAGSSAPRRPDDAAAARNSFERLVGEITRAGLLTVVAGTCPSDAWLESAAASCGVPWVPPTVPLGTALTVLAGASAFVSGRYHPSILATLVGTPIVLMASNSHKSESLHTVLGSARAVTHPFLNDRPDIAALADDVLAAAATPAEDRAAIRARAVALASTLVSDVRTAA